MITLAMLSIIIAAAIAATVRRRRPVPATRRELRRAYLRSRADLRAMRPQAQRLQWVPVVRLPQ